MTEVERLAMLRRHLDLVIQALHELEPVEDFVRRVATRLEGRGA